MDLAPHTWSSAARAVALTVALGVSLGAASTASATTVTDSRGGVKASFTYVQSKDKLTTSLKRLEIERDGALVLSDDLRKFKGSAPGGFKDQPSLKVSDLDGDGEPEVLLTQFTGGAHCCVTAEIYSYRAATTSYKRVETNFGSAGFHLRNLDREGVLEFQTVDPAFEDAYTSHVESRSPIQILRQRKGKLGDVTRSFPALVRRDLAALKKAYPRYRKDKANARGVLASIAAEQIVLGQRRGLAATYDRAAKAYGAQFVRSLKRFLRRTGYRS